MPTTKNEAERIIKEFGNHKVEIRVWLVVLIGLAGVILGKVW